ncbi:MAG: hypothetical protein V8S96_06105 [Lachnospiraceae bacterium]
MVFLACLFLIMAVVNPIFVHNGETILFFYERQSGDDGSCDLRGHGGSR